MTSENTTHQAAVDRAKRGIAGKLSRPFTDVDVIATDIVNALIADGWQAPVARQRSSNDTPNDASTARFSTSQWRPENPASDDSRRAHLTGIRQRLDTIRDARKHTETEDPQ